jgi:hypothetical protein
LNLQYFITWILGLQSECVLSSIENVGTALGSIQSNSENERKCIIKHYNDKRHHWSQIV